MKTGKVLGRLASFLRPYLGGLVLSLLLAVAAVASTLTVPVITGQAMDNICGAGKVNFSSLPRYALMIALFSALAALCQWLSAYISNKATTKAMLDMRVRTFDSISSASLSYIDSTPHGKILNTVTNDIEQICDGLTAALTQLFTGAATIIGTLGFMFRVDYIVALTVILLTPLSMAVAAVIARGSHKYFVQTTAAQARLNSCAEEMLTCRETVSVYGYNERACSRFDEVNSELKKCGFISQLYSAMANPSTRFVNAMIYAAAGVIGALSAVSGRMSVGEISTFLIYAGQYTKPFNEISGVVAQLQSSLASAQRVFEIIDAPREYEPDVPSELPGELHGEISFENLSFSYSADKKLIENMSLSVPPSSRVAIVGKTGSGKTTLINLLMRFYSPDSGRITLDGQDIAGVKSDKLRSRFGMVLQDTQLFEGTVRYNIAYGRPDASDEEIERAAKLASAHSFIRRLPEGYDTVIGASSSLSHGQKQLICIARALLCNPDIALLDEATSGIDINTEQTVQKAFSEFMHGRTSFVVAHRLDTIKNSDIILVMENGHIAECGTHSELLSLGGVYSRLYASMEE